MVATKRVGSLYTEKCGAVFEQGNWPPAQLFSLCHLSIKACSQVLHVNVWVGISGLCVVFILQYIVEQN